MKTQEYADLSIENKDNGDYDTNKLGRLCEGFKILCKSAHDYLFTLAASSFTIALTSLMPLIGEILHPFGIDDVHIVSLAVLSSNIAGLISTPLIAIFLWRYQKIE